MRITINNKAVELDSDFMTIAEMMQQHGIKREGTAIALNNKIVKHENWDNTRLNEGDAITVISAAFGG